MGCSKANRDANHSSALATTRFFDSWVVIDARTILTARRAVDCLPKLIDVTHLSVARYGIAGNATLLELSKDVWVTNTAPTFRLLRTMTIAAQSEELTVADLPLTYPVYGATLALEHSGGGTGARAPDRGDREAPAPADHGASARKPV